MSMGVSRAPSRVKVSRPVRSAVKPEERRIGESPKRNKGAMSFLSGVFSSTPTLGGVKSDRAASSLPTATSGWTENPMYKPRSARSAPPPSTISRASVPPMSEWTSNPMHVAGSGSTSRAAPVEGLPELEAVGSAESTDADLEVEGPGQESPEASSASPGSATKEKISLLKKTVNSWGIFASRGEDRALGDIMKALNDKLVDAEERIAKEELVGSDLAATMVDVEVEVRGLESDLRTALLSRDEVYQVRAGVGEKMTNFISRLDVMSDEVKNYSLELVKASRSDIARAKSVISRQKGRMKKFIDSVSKAKRNIIGKIKLGFDVVTGVASFGDAIQGKGENTEKASSWFLSEVLEPIKEPINNVFETVGESIMGQAIPGVSFVVNAVLAPINLIRGIFARSGMKKAAKTTKSYKNLLNKYEAMKKPFQKKLEKFETSPKERASAKAELKKINAKIKTIKNFRRNKEESNRAEKNEKFLESAANVVGVGMGLVIAFGIAATPVGIAALAVGTIIMVGKGGKDFFTKRKKAAQIKQAAQRSRGLQEKTRAMLKTLDVKRSNILADPKHTTPRDREQAVDNLFKEYGTTEQDFDNYYKSVQSEDFLLEVDYTELMPKEAQGDKAARPLGGMGQLIDKLSEEIDVNAEIDVLEGFGLNDNTDKLLERIDSFRELDKPSPGDHTLGLLKSRVELQLKEDKSDLFRQLKKFKQKPKSTTTYVGLKKMVLRMEKEKMLHEMLKRDETPKSRLGKLWQKIRGSVGTKERGAIRSRMEGVHERSPQEVREQLGKDMKFLRKNSPELAERMKEIALRDTEGDMRTSLQEYTTGIKPLAVKEKWEALKRRIVR